jgi:periplasmic copper chaperone A
VKNIFFVGVLLLLGACSSDTSMKISNMWVRPGKMDGNSAAYFTITNNTKEDDRLVSAETSTAEKCEIHMTKIDENNKMMMMPQESIQIRSGGKVDFAPGGFHIMILNLHKDFIVGENIRLTLHFEKTGKLDLDFPVKE